MPRSVMAAAKGFDAFNSSHAGRSAQAQRNGIGADDLASVGVMNSLHRLRCRRHPRREVSALTAAGGTVETEVGVELSPAASPGFLFAATQVRGSGAGEPERGAR